MCKAIFLLNALLGLLLISSSAAHAQETTANEGWPVVERCIGEPTTPPEGWSFEGTILYIGTYGIHGIRSEWSTSHVLAFTNIATAGRHMYLGTGNLSPDMAQYAAVEGFSQCGDVHCSGTLNHIHKLHIFDVTGNNPRGYVTYELDISYPQLQREYDGGFVVWINEYQIVYPSYPPTDYRSNSILFDLNSNERKNLFPEPNPGCWGCSPDRTRQTVVRSEYDPKDKNGNVRLFYELWSYPQNEVITSIADKFLPPWIMSWSTDSQHFLVIHFEENSANLALYDRDGNRIGQASPLLDIDPDSLHFVTMNFDVNWSPDGNYIWLNTGSLDADSTYLLDIQNHVAYDLCQTLLSGKWSPDSKQFVFNHYSRNQPDASRIAVYNPTNGTVYQVADGYILGWRTD